MHSSRPASRIFAFASFVVALVTVGCSAENDEVSDVSDPGFLPTGTYSLQIVAASCNVNPMFQSSERVALFRNKAGAPAGVNIPLPTKLALASESSVFGVAHQDVDLSKKHVSFSVEDPNGCGMVPTSIDVTELSPTRLAVSYREGARESCDVPECSVEYAFDLVEAACPRDCNSTGATLHVGPNRSMIWRCDCQ